MSNILSLRLTHDELVKVSAMACSDVTGCETKGEFLRLLIHREWNRRHSLPKPKAADWQTSFRGGRAPFGSSLLSASIYRRRLFTGQKKVTNKQDRSRGRNRHTRALKR